MSQRHTIEVTEVEWSESRERMNRSSTANALVGLVLVTALSTLAVFVGTSVTSGALRYLVIAGVTMVLLVPAVFAMRSSSIKQRELNLELAATLQRELAEALDRAQAEANQREAQVHRQEFETRLASALEMADGEPEVIEAVQRAFVATLPESPIEMLLADNSRAHLLRVAVSSPTGEPPHCGVDSPDRCPAARRAQVRRFSDSEELDACPKLRGRTQGRCSAVCVPVSIMGRTVGVIHATGEPFAAFGEEAIHDLGTLANLAGARIGLLRLMAETQLQAATDSLTGLSNRRAFENNVRVLRNTATPFAMVMADLDHFKALNDTYGHETGDRALRLFAQTLSGTLRNQDLVCRHGGEEFAVVLPSCTGVGARACLENVRANLAAAVSDAGLPKYTASFGVVEADEDEDLPTLIGRADAALFEAKRGGRDRIVVHDANGKAVTPAPRDAGDAGDAENDDASLKMNGARPGGSRATRTVAQIPLVVND